MKKIISIMLVLSMLLSFASVSLAAEPTSQVLESTNIVNVTGQLEEGGDYVNVLLLDNSNNVKYINEFPVEADGSYRAKFKYNGDIKGLSLQVKQGLSNVTDSVVSAISEKEALAYDLNVVNTPIRTEISAEIENYYNVEGKTYTVVIAYYDENNKLLDVCVQDEKTIANDKTKDQTSYDILEGASKIKVFMWNSVKTMIPLAKEVIGKKNDTIRVLAIGNSFSQDSTAYLSAIAQKDGINMTVRVAQKGGATFSTHWTAWAAVGDARNIYTVSNVARDIDYFLDDGSVYDYIIVQQVSEKSGLYETYDENADNMLKYIRERQPTAEILIHQVWSYEKGSTHAGFANYDKDQTTMHNAIKSAVTEYCKYAATLTTESGKPISLDGKPLRHIPTGDAFMNARANLMFDTTYTGTGSSVVDTTKICTLHRDGYHASFNYGRYLAALTWYACFTGNSVINNAYTSSEYPIPEAARPIINAAAQKAVDESGIWN